MTMTKWIEVNNIGELYTEEVLVFFDVPLLFVCKDNKDKRYLILCIDEEEGRYLCSPTTNEWLLKLLTDEVPMAEVFRNPADGKNLLIDYDFTKGFSSKYIDVSALTADMLPDENAYFKLKNQKITEYIEALQKEEDSIVCTSMGFTFNNFQAIHPKQKMLMSFYSNNKRLNMDIWELSATNSYSILFGNCAHKIIKPVICTHNRDIHNREFENKYYQVERSNSKECLVKVL